MRTADSCPICTTYIDASCIIYNGLYLKTIDVEPKDSLEEALGKINASLSTLQPLLGFTPENVANKSPNNTLGGATPSDTLYPTQKAVKDYIGDGLRPYQSYVALLTQSGTSDPVATILENTLGGVPVWTRSTTGTYAIQLTGAFPVGKTVCTLVVHANDSTGRIVSEYNYAGAPNDDSRGFVVQNATTNSNSDGIAALSWIEIRVYP